MSSVLSLKSLRVRAEYQKRQSPLRFRFPEYCKQMARDEIPLNSFRLNGHTLVFHAQT